MADRPRGGSTGDEDSEEFGWLYGGDRDHAPQHSDPDPTRVLPATPRTESSGGRGNGGRGGAATATKASPPPPRPPTRRPRRKRRLLLGIVVIWLAFLIAVPLWAWSKIDKVDIETADKPAAQGGTTYLLVGSDSREGLSKEQRRKLGTGDAAGQRTDTIMLLHTGSGPSLLMSIPRDSLVPIPGHGTNKINAAFAYGGAKLLTETIEQNTGVRVDHYVEIGFGGFVRAIDAIGGIEICPKDAVKDKDANINIKAGCQEADGATALGYSRSRKAFKALGDVQRAANQRAVIAAIGDGVKSPWTFINPVRYFRVNNAMTKSVKISEGTSPIALANFAFAMTRVGSKGLTCGIPIQDLSVKWDRERALQFLKFIKQDKVGEMPKQLCTDSGLPE